ncbi:MAG: type I restriction enzyme HsdR N-terminal domain-containing protein [Nitrospirota bacterium]
MGRKRILGKTTDFITGREIKDTDDERYRQKLARFLVEERGYKKEDIVGRLKFRFDIDGRNVLSMIDFVVEIDGKSFMIIKYGPGSLVTRERPALAIARVLEQYQIPLTVVTNGEEAEIIDTASGEVIATGIESIPGRDYVLEKFKDLGLKSLSIKQLDAEKRIISAYDYIEHSLECDDDWCETE